jgi:hypothetical protein
MRYEIKSLGVGGILDQAVQLLKNHFALFMGISMCISVPFGLVFGFVTYGLRPQFPPGAAQEDIARIQQEFLLSNFPVIMGMVFVSMIFVYPLTTGAMIHAVASEYLGNPTTVGASLRRAFRVFLPLLWTSMLMFILVYLGLFLCILPGVLLMFRYALSSQAVVLEGRSGSNALKRSKELMLYDRTKNYNTLFLLWLLLVVIGFGINSGANFIPQPHVAIVVSVLLQAVNGAFWAAALAVFYFSCRCKAENFDLVLLAEAMKTESPESASS